MTAADRPSVTPRAGDTITTAEQLDALPVGSVVLHDSDVDPPGIAVMQRSVHTGAWYLPAAVQRVEPLLPVTVLFVPSRPVATCGHPNHGADDHDCAPFLPSVTDNARADLHPVVTEHQIIGTQTGKQGAGQVVPEDSVLCIKCGWMRCSDYTWHLSDALAAAGRAKTPAGLTVSEDGSVLNWQGVNYVPQRAERPACTWSRCRSPLTGKCFAWCKCICHEWSAAQQAAGRAETTTATVEDAVDELRAWAVIGDGITPADDDEEWIDRTILSSAIIDGRTERIEGRPETIVQRLAAAGLLATARTRPTRDGGES